MEGPTSTRALSASISPRNTSAADRHRLRGTQVQPPPTRATVTLDVQPASNASGDESLQDSRDRPSGSGVNETTLERRMHRLEEHYSSIQKSLDEIRSMVAKLSQDSFKIKGSQYEDPMNEELSKAFCQSLKRDIPVPKLQELVCKVLRHDKHDLNKCKRAMTYAKSKLNQFRAEERRKIVGINPYTHCKSMPAAQLAEILMKSMKAPKDVKEVYTRHIAILRRYVRNGGCTENLYDGFRPWVSLCEQDLDWAAVMDEDRHACAEQPTERGETTLPEDSE